MTILNNRFKSFIKFLTKILLLSIIGALVYLAGDYTYNNHQERIILEEEVIELKNLQKIEKEKNISNLKREILNKLYSDEFGGNWEKRRASGDNLETFDPANRNYKKCSTRGGTIRNDCLSLGVGQLQLERAMIFQNQLIGKKIYSKDSKMTEREMKAKLIGDTGFYDEFILNAIINIPASIYKWSSASDDRSYYDAKISDLRKLIKENEL